MVKLIYGKARTGKTELARELFGLGDFVLGNSFSGLFEFGQTVKTFFQPGTPVEKCKHMALFEGLNRVVIDDFFFLYEEEWVDILSKAPQADFILIGDPLFQTFTVPGDEEWLPDNHLLLHFDGVRDGDLGIVGRLPEREGGLVLTSISESIRVNMNEKRLIRNNQGNLVEKPPIFFVKSGDSITFGAKTREVTGGQKLYIDGMPLTFDKLDGSEYFKYPVNCPHPWQDFKGITVGSASVDPELRPKELYYSLTRIIGTITRWKK